ncbi:MAG: ankyrin repeat domain-containing protein [Armatimonadota bacterium]
MTYTIYDAAADGDLSSVKDLFSYDKSQANKEDPTGWTPLHYAAAGDHVDIAKFLIENGADINHKTSTDGKSALHWAAFHGNLPVIEQLVSMGAMINDKDDDGNTALEIAKQTEKRNLIHFLEEHGGQ